MFSAVHPITDIAKILQHVRFVPETEVAAYSITSSARAMGVGGTVRPSALAVLRLMANSCLVGAAGLAAARAAQ